MALKTLVRQGAVDGQMLGDLNDNFTYLAGAGAPPVPNTRLISTGAGLSGGGDLSADRTLIVDPSFIQYATVALTLADLLALFSVPKVIVAAPAAGSVLEFLGAILEYTKGSAAFTIGSAGNATVNYKADASGGAVSTTRAATGFFDQNGVKISRLGPITTTLDLSVLTAQPLVLTLATADMSVGTGSSGLIKVAYRVHTGL